jgi:hypothetical protein
LFLIKSLAMLGAVIFGGLALWNLTPIVAQQMAHARIGLLLWGARRNPIPELYSHYEKRFNKLKKSAMAVTELGKARYEYERKYNEFAIKLPARAAEFKKTLDKMTYVYQKQLRDLANMRIALSNFELVIAEARMIWDMTQAQLKASGLLSKFKQADPMDAIREQTALDSVYSSLDRVGADLDVSMAIDYNTVENVDTLPQQAAISLSPSEILEVDISKVKENVNVSSTR